MEANSAMTFYGQEKVEYNAQLCLMNMAVHGLNGIIKSGDEANTFYHDAHNLDGCCDYVMANPPFNVDKVNSESAQSAGRLPFGLPSVNAKKEFGNANYLWISYFYSYLNEHGRAGFRYGVLRHRQLRQGPRHSSKAGGDRPCRCDGQRGK